MRREEIEALAKEWEASRDTAEGKDAAACDDVSAAFARGQGDAFEACARMLREALAKSEAVPAMCAGGHDYARPIPHVVCVRCGDAKVTP